MNKKDLITTKFTFKDGEERTVNCAGLHGIRSKKDGSRPFKAAVAINCTEDEFELTEHIKRFIFSELPSAMHALCHNNYTLEPYWLVKAIFAERANSAKR